MRKAAKHLGDASMRLFQYRKGAMVKAPLISPCCWNSHVQALLCSEDIRLMTQRWPRIERRRNVWKNKVHVRPLSMAAVTVAHPIEVHHDTTQPKDAERRSSTLPTSLSGPLSIFNLSNQVMLANLEHALRKNQAEQAWSIFKTLTTADLTNYIPLSLCSELYSLLAFAKALAGNGKVSTYRQGQMDELAEYVEVEFDIPRQQFIASVQVRPISRHKKLIQAIKRRNLRTAWSIFTDMCKAQGGTLSKDISRNTCLKLLSLLQHDKKTDSREIAQRMALVAKQHAMQTGNQCILSAEEVLILAKVYHQLETGDKAAAHAIMMDAGRFASPDLVVELVWRAVQFGELTAAERLVDQVETRPDYDTHTIHQMAYVNLIGGYRQKHIYSRALGIFKRLLETNTTPNIRAFNAVLQVFAELGDAQKTAFMFDTLLQLGLSPDEATFSEVIRGHANAGHLQTAIQYYHAMQKHHVQPNAYTFSIIIEAFSVQNNIRNVIRWFQIMLDHNVSPNQVIISCVLKAFKGQAAVYPNVAEAVQQIVSHAIGAGIKADVSLYTILLQLQAEVGGIQSALAVHREMLARHIEPNTYTYTVLIDICGKNESPETAQQIFDLMKSSNYPPNTITYCAIMDAWARANQSERVSALAKELVEQARTDTSGRIWIDETVREYIRMAFLDT